MRAKTFAIRSPALLFDAHEIKTLNLGVGNITPVSVILKISNPTRTLSCERFSVQKIVTLHATFLQFAAFFCALAHLKIRPFMSIFAQKPRGASTRIKGSGGIKLWLEEVLQAGDPSPSPRSG
jgi:hypothetical protein